MKNYLRLLSLALLATAPGAWATCYKVDSVGTENTTVQTAIRPGEGTASA